MQQLIDLFSKPPASFAWATNNEGRTLGTSEGFVLDIWTDTVEAAVLFPPDNSRLVRRNTMLCLLLLLVLRPNWADPERWLTEQMRQANRFRPTKKQPFYQTTENTQEQVRFSWDKIQSRVTLSIPTPRL